MSGKRRLDPLMAPIIPTVRYNFDQAATTPLHPDVLRAMIDIYEHIPGNPSSTHAAGRAARKAVNAARDTLAEILHCPSNELIFTSGGTESNNTALRGIAHALRKIGKNHIITSAIEHHSVLRTVESLQQEGYTVTFLPVDEYGVVRPETLRSALTPQTGLVSIMFANNETGTLEPITQLGDIAHAHGAYMHVDAVQALGHVALNVQALPVDAMSFTAHKLHGPVGVGALYLKTHTPFIPLLTGGSQEKKRRAGTENVAGIVGFATAAQIAAKNILDNEQLFMQTLRLYWIEKMYEIWGRQHIALNEHPDPSQRLENIVNLSFLGMDNETMLMNLDLAGIAASAGSACSAGSLEPSQVLYAMGLPATRWQTAIRFSFGLGNTIEELGRAAQVVASLAQRRALS
jgi:cysteine desulfurase